MDCPNPRQAERGAARSTSTSPRSLILAKTWNANLLDVSRRRRPVVKDEECGGRRTWGAQISWRTMRFGTLYGMGTLLALSDGTDNNYFSLPQRWADRLGSPAWVFSLAGARGFEHFFPCSSSSASGSDVRASLDGHPQTLKQWKTHTNAVPTTAAHQGRMSRKLSRYVHGYRYINQKGFHFPFFGGTIFDSNRQPRR